MTQRVHIITIDPPPLCVVSTYAQAKLCNHTSCAENKLACPSCLVQICKFKKTGVFRKSFGTKGIITLDPLLCAKFVPEWIVLIVCGLVDCIWIVRLHNFGTKGIITLDPPLCQACARMDCVDCV